MLTHQRLKSRAHRASFSGAMDFNTASAQKDRRFFDRAPMRCDNISPNRRDRDLIPLNDRLCEQQQLARHSTAQTHFPDRVLSEGTCNFNRKHS